MDMCTGQVALITIKSEPDDPARDQAGNMTWINLIFSRFI
jgi:hypothetical protein